jgi:RNA polymerase-binding transcription factor DksA
MTKISNNQNDTLKTMIEAELTRLVRETRNEMNPQAKPSYIDVGGDGNAADEAVADTIVDTDNAVIGLHLQQANDLNAALDRMLTGAYGTCIDCNDSIGFKRLSAYPTAKRCISCQQLHEKLYYRS